ncbi:HepT-like ribonuclease domain-containing protein [Micropruina sp.]|uniref:HepT-like ribonuclease domain-containing protein n=1 Tax=Micropruina sp. TaxID=2737536 RepID=UPI0039E2B389
MSRPTEGILSDALTHLQTMQAYGGRDLDDQLVIDAICMRLSAGIETLATLDAELRESLFGNNWPLMWGRCNRIARGYLLVDSAIVYQTLKYDIPTIVAPMRST